ncbi:MAG: phenazine biosynthesis protein PhzF [Nocardioides sp.]|nr:phenazine biosynthesis protein PhzF [Nocardioides sp.]
MTTPSAPDAARPRRLTQVDVFGSTGATSGNPVAVVHDAEGMSTEEMAAFARWTNLSETTFLLAPEHPDADYRVRIFTPGQELPFAGHPTLGTAHAWLEAGGVPARDGVVVQECGVGLVDVRRGIGGRLAFAAPPLVRSGPPTPDDLAVVRELLGLAEDAVVDAAWTDNGPGWLTLLLRDADAVLAVRPGPVTAEVRRRGLVDLGLVGPHPAGSEVAVEVRAFFLAGTDAWTEDPVTGSLNAGVAVWLGGGGLPTSYVAAQGTALGRAGRVHVELDPHDPAGIWWIGGETRSTIRGEVSLDGAPRG